LTYSVAVLSVAAALVAGLLFNTFCKLIRSYHCFFARSCSLHGLVASARGCSRRAFHFGIRLLFRAAYQFVRRGIKDIPRIVLFAIAALFVVSLSAPKKRSRISATRA